ncbi:hypothetical protein HDA32_002003 [Spinactinospora alkalitolerans]|uniref:DUF397 domain-containing protein n=1 Tax=Spinactinospora alkalitolerans TaxID=687207 RepID=A0A852TVM8_9ACTN|nr:DUF397 domain-containing protein [Spinactinospora alkalitolerans]NYE46883.1 hypothetical protein [Spinactinospora alkalitolerans]
MKSEFEFHKSSYSANGQNCVEVAENVPGVAAVRDTKSRDRGHLPFAAGEWSAFLEAVKHGEL